MTNQESPDGRPVKIDVRLEISKIVGAMLDGPQDRGIYQTTKCYDALEDLFARLRAEQQEQEPIGEVIISDRCDSYTRYFTKLGAGAHKLYASPIAKEPVAQDGMVMVPREPTAEEQL